MVPQTVTLFGSSHRATAPTDSGGRALGMFSYPKVPSVMTSASAKPFSTSPLTTPLRQFGSVDDCAAGQDIVRVLVVNERERPV